MFGPARPVSRAEFVLPDQFPNDDFVVDMAPYTTISEQVDQMIESDSFFASLFDSAFSPAHPRTNRVRPPAYSSVPSSDRMVPSVVQVVGSTLSNLASRASNLLNQASNVLAVASIGLRKEVPFERWYFDHNFDTPIEDGTALIEAHFWAVLAAGEGILRTIAAVASYAFALAFLPKETALSLDILNAQWRGLTLSVLAIVSPNQAKKNVFDSGRITIGAAASNYNWGTLYTG